MVTSYQFNKQKLKTPVRELDPQERIKMFDEVSLGYTTQEAIAEASRCVQCSNAPCVSGCPVGVPIPQFLEQVARGDFAAAHVIIHAANVLPAVCGRVCPQETQCEGRCTRGRNGDPVSIGRLERFVADWALDHHDEALKACAAKALLDEDDSSVDLSGKRIACVGSGPASLTCAGELIKLGAEVVVFEAFHEVGGVLVYGIPEFRLPKKLVAREVASLSEGGVRFELNSLVGRLYDIDELIGEQGFDAVFVGTGAGLPSYLHIEGEGLNGVMVANELLTRVNLMKAYRFPEYETPIYVGKTCVVVGGGNVAMDAARTVRRLGADVTVVYRRGRDEMPAREEEIHHAEEEGIKFQLLTDPTRALGNDEGWVRGLECTKMELGAPDLSGRCRPIVVEGSNFVIDADMVVVAIRSKTNPLIAQTTPGLEVTSRHLIIADDETCATSKPGVFAGGDAVIGAATVILAMGAGKRAARGIVDYLTGK